jgi:hypothetical protein
MVVFPPAVERFRRKTVVYESITEIFDGPDMI